jgi:hypothetical protein
MHHQTSTGERPSAGAPVEKSGELPMRMAVRAARVGLMTYVM